MSGTASNSLCSIAVAGFDSASICSASSAAISAGTKTRMNTIVPSRRDRFIEGDNPRLAACLSRPALAARLLTRPLTILATTQPAKPIAPAATTSGSTLSI